MTVLFYLLLIFVTPIRFNMFWFIISIIFSLVEAGGQVIYRYTTDPSLAGHTEEL